MWGITSDKDYDEAPFKGLLASHESTTPLNRPNLQKKQILRVWFCISHSQNKKIDISSSMGFFASACIHSLPVDGCILPVIVFTMNLHHFLHILLLQREANCKPIATKYG
jgi:hypothetical protein